MDPKFEHVDDKLVPQKDLGTAQGSLKERFLRLIGSHQGDVLHLRDVESLYFSVLIEMCNGNVAELGRIAGMSRWSAGRRLRKLNLLNLLDVTRARFE